MTRSVPEWIGKTDSTPVPPRVRLRVYDKFDGRCAVCGIALQDRHWTCDHKIALINGGENRETNLQSLGNACCNKEKNKRDVAQKAQTYRTRSRHLGIKKRSGFLTNKIGPFRKKMNGTVERR